MKNRPRFQNIFWVLVAAAIMLAGCVGTSSPVTFYTLNPLSGVKPDSSGDIADRNIAVGVGPVTFPGYLDRPQIVTRRGQSRIEISEFHRWGDSLLKSFSRILAKNISILLPTNQVNVYPWRDGFSPVYRVKLDVEQFDGQLGDFVLLDVTWSVTGPENVDMVVRTSAIEERMSTTDHDGLVAAMSRALAALSREIVEVISRIEAM
ncbi:MAG: membrane integrity-associated transporter subunit PqiC [Deltaproteobacteria bacterium]|nr:membrane integrity-associated transporter subunit PqiC [Deltaproteobacteria bacterium]